ncbi:uncharacterized protein LOC133031411 [Cannabis sativa]|uniref:uncharacterized protein LOC133031411 n=1 Tax=Cannabis sativa TaxID=3483 RepID=UPI0029CA7496|nr:uncharacterized protein LOC133031411 [Cannabis sativa]
MRSSDEEENERIKEAQMQDPKLVKTRDRVLAGKASDFSVLETRMLQFRNRVCVPMDDGIKREIMDESHTTPYSVHPGLTKMYQDLKEMFWWQSMKNDIAEEIVRRYGFSKSIVSDRDLNFTSRFWESMKNDIADYVAKCLTCQRIKAKHKRPARLLEPLNIPEWIWEDIPMDFVVGLDRTTRQFDCVWVIVERLTKSAPFLLVRTNFSIDQFAELYVREIVRRYGVSKSIVSDRDPNFTSRFLESLH